MEWQASSVEAPAAKPKDLSSTPGTHNRKIIAWPPHMCPNTPRPYTSHMHTVIIINKNNNSKVFRNK